MTVKPKPLLRRGSMPLSRILDVGDLKDTPLEVTIEADADERQAVASEAGLQSIDRLAATLVVRRRPGDLIDVTGEVDALVAETCVVSLEPFEQQLRAPVSLSFAPLAHAEAPPPRGRSKRGNPPIEAAPRSTSPRTISVEGPDGGEDEPDPLVDGRIDLGAVAVEFMNLARNPYPKKPDVHFPDVVANDDEEEEPTALALALGRLKDRS